LREAIDRSFEGVPHRVSLPGPYVVEIHMLGGRVEEVPSDFGRHFVDPGHRERSEAAAEGGRRVFGQRLRTLRSERGLTQQQLAEGAKINRVTIARFETGSGSRVIERSQPLQMAWACPWRGSWRAERKLPASSAHAVASQRSSGWPERLSKGRIATRVFSVALASLGVLTAVVVDPAATADVGGDFVVVLDKPLTPGDYQITIRATNPCVTADTRLATQYGLVCIGDLYTSAAPLEVTVDRRALGEREPGVTVRPAVSAFMTSASADVYRVVTKDGYEIKATKWHDFYTTRGKIKLKELQLGDELLIQSGKGQFGSEGDAQLGMLLGLLAVITGAWQAHAQSTPAAAILARAGWEATLRLPARLRAATTGSVLEVKPSRARNPDTSPSIAALPGAVPPCMGAASSIASTACLVSIAQLIAIPAFAPGSCALRPAFLL
jgi:DNA-binding XRE family transcriptional regulator